MMDRRILARIGAVVFVGVAVPATVIELTRKEEEPQFRILQPNIHGDATTSREMLRHCRDIGEAATRDLACLKLWADNRDRFLGRGRTSTPASEIMLAPSEPASADQAPPPTRTEPALSISSKNEAR